MVYLKSIAAGLAASVAVLIGAVLFEVIRTVLIITWLRRSGSGGIGAVSSGLGPGLFPAVATAFVVGFWWQFRRQMT
jgi:hypothetical protein